MTNNDLQNIKHKSKASREVKYRKPLKGEKEYIYCVLL